MIKVENLTKEFKVHKKAPGLMGSLSSLFNREYITKQAIKDINLEIHQGEILGLIGSNGAGKTTLTKILSGIIHPTSGKVSVLGFNPWERDNRYRSQMSLIMGQKAQLWWDLPAADGFLLLKEIYRIDDKNFKERLAYLSESLGIEKELNVQVRKLSLGERMKVELIAALLHSPKVVFLDEPTIGLDLSAQKAVRRFIKDYRKEFNPIMILTSHYMDDIEDLCERIVIMKEGQFVYDGGIKQVHQKYATSKMVTAQASAGIDRYAEMQKFPKSLGEIEISENGKIAVRSPREKVMEAASYLIHYLKIEDLNISEEDIGDVIEHIMDKGHKA
ncbi:MAG: ATP-binding cassette domain-containing protein [Bacteriovoracaceae bacterium]|nr:ATP-binding cassette domain-containing protein [Bacteriovoracaceae bacterium]